MATRGTLEANAALAGSITGPAIVVHEKDAFSRIFRK